MRSPIYVAASSLLLLLLPSAAQANLGGQLPDLAHDIVDWTAGSVSQIGQRGSDGGAARTQGAWTFVDCGEPEDAIEIKSLRVVPDPPEPGKRMTIYADGTAKQRIDEGAYADVVVKLGLIKLIQKRFDICEELRNANASMQCPIEKGDHAIVQSVDLPKEIPKAKFTVEALAYTQPPETPMACAKIIIDFMDHH